MSPVYVVCIGERMTKYRLALPQVYANKDDAVDSARAVAEKVKGSFVRAKFQPGRIVFACASREKKIWVEQLHLVGEPKR